MRVPADVAQQSGADAAAATTSQRVRRNPAPMLVAVQPPVAVRGLCVMGVSGWSRHP
ncbi:hypothetical protein BJY16_001218 [Actinoplanes octamycinicus]|uniref:Uncharacterized protein n=1 Tax=Actinoplanes octamycinicus TaxID=135948 RepID=A0A7W7GSZ7_9ACTN|nr:hypothetical protein [Actinoplanes octamycinicus]